MDNILLEYISKGLLPVFRTFLKANTGCILW